MHAACHALNMHVCSRAYPAVLHAGKMTQYAMASAVMRTSFSANRKGLSEIRICFVFGLFGVHYSDADQMTETQSIFPLFLGFRRRRHRRHLGERLRVLVKISLAAAPSGRGSYPPEHHIISGTPYGTLCAPSGSYSALIFGVFFNSVCGFLIFGLSLALGRDPMDAQPIYKSTQFTRAQ